VEEELSEELQFHIDMQTEENVRAGMSPQEARRQAVLLFGGVEGHKEECREARGAEVRAARLSWLDFKLGLRMLAPLVGGLAITVATGFGAAFFEFTGKFLNPRLPLPEAERIVAVENWDYAAGGGEPRSLHELGIWRERAESVDHLAAYMGVEHALVTGDGRSEVVYAAQMSAAAFRVAGIAPLLGRPLMDADEEEGAPPVVVIGHDVWRRLFDDDPGVVGRTVRLGSATATVAGVMPEGFRFPMNYEAWTPLPRRLLA
jgi:hypothetical protein